MRKLLTFRGAAGCGKSTFIKEHGLEDYTISADVLRLMYGSPVMNADASFATPQANDKAVWGTLYSVLETRMKNGDFTVLDCTNTSNKTFGKLKELAEEYRYRVYMVDMTDIPIEEVKRRNRLRPVVKQVPDEVIDRMYRQIEENKVPSFIKVIKPEELDAVWHRPIDLSKKNKIHILSDIHGCNTVLQNYLEANGGIKDDEYYIFAGDYLDRGMENVETFKTFMGLYNKPNVCLLEGNHERHLRAWGAGRQATSREFEENTRKQLEKAHIAPSDARRLCRSLGQCMYFTYNEKAVLVTHGGLSCIPENLTLVSTENMIKGAGRFSETEIVDEAFCLSTDENTYQIHGHRNTDYAPCQSTERTFNLENSVEFGGNMRAVQLSKDGFKIIETPNPVFNSVLSDEFIKTTGDKNITDTQMVEYLRNSKAVKEKSFGRISSFNFTRNAFSEGAWNWATIKARGLFIDTQENKIVARSYDKFFNIDERPETKLEALKDTFSFPLSVYLKENGFLGIVGWNPEEDDILITTKSSITGDYSRYFKDSLYAVYGYEKIEKMKKYIKRNNLSFVFECCDVKHDRHIIEYPETKVVLLDVISNTVQFNKIPYGALVKLADEIGFKVKQRVCKLMNWGEFEAWFNEASGENYLYNGKPVEGFVIEDANSFMVKYKTYYYKRWKALRGIAASVLKLGDSKHAQSLITDEDRAFYKFCKDLYSSDEDERKRIWGLSEAPTGESDIVTLRKLFFKLKEN